MILSNRAIFEALDAKRLIIDPEPRPRLATDDPSRPSPYQTSSVDLRLGNEISSFKEGLAINIDLARGRFADLFGPNSDTRTITVDQPYRLSPGKFVLANTLERVELPICEDGPCLAARVEGRSSLARCGLLIHFTAPTIHAGYSGKITFEIINLGPIPITLSPGSYICQLIIEEVKGTPHRADSQFQGQMKPGGGTR